MQLYKVLSCLSFLFLIIINLYSSNNNPRQIKFHSSVQQNIQNANDNKNMYFNIIYSTDHDMFPSQSMIDDVKKREKINNSDQDKKIKEKLHHNFNGEKWYQTANYLYKDLSNNGNPFNLKYGGTSFISAKEVSYEQLSIVHTQEYLKLVQTDADFVADLINQKDKLKGVRIESLDDALLQSMRFMTYATVMAVHLALQSENKWAINFGGGFHHAKREYTKKNAFYAGFCIYADIPLAIKSILVTYPDLKILIVDLDAHRGNGNGDFLKNNEHLREQVKIFDMYTKGIYPVGDTETLGYVSYNFPLAQGVGTQEYLSALKENLPKVLQEFQPGLIIYNAGTDPLSGDPLGGMKVSAQGILERDAFVFQCAKNNNIAIAMVTSGGYSWAQKDYISLKETPEKIGSAELIYESVMNLANKKLINFEHHAIDKNKLYDTIDSTFNHILSQDTPPVLKQDTNNEKSKTNNNDNTDKRLSNTQKLCVGVGIGILVVMAYCLKHKINPITTLKNLLDKNTN